MMNLKRLGQAGLRGGLIAATSVFALAVSSPALGQESAAQEAGDSDAQSSSGSVIVVTARKREENLQEVPISLDVIGGDYLDNGALTRIDDIQFSIPGVAIETFETGGRVSIRGVGSATSGLGSEDSVAVHLDGVYLSFPGQALSNVFDVERLEVLKGPQGTLYGRNATAGVLNIISRRPGSGPRVEADLTYGSFDTWRLNVAGDLVENDTGGIRLAFTRGVSDGYEESQFGPIYGDDDFWAVRLTADAQITDNLLMEVTAQYGEDDSTEKFTLSPSPTQPSFIGFNRNFIDTPPVSAEEDLSIGVKFDLELGDFTIRSLTGYADHSAFALFDIDPQNDLPIDDPARDTLELTLDERFEQFSQELQLQWSAPGGRTDAVVGLYYLTTDGGEFRNISAGNFPNIIDSADNAEGEVFGIFAEANHFLSDQLRINFGLRYNDESRDVDTTGSGFFDFPGFTDGTASFDSVSGRAGIDYFVSDDTMLFASVSRGFKAGGLIPVVLVTSAGAELDSFEPETLWAYEAGIKHTFPGNTGVLNVSGYYYDYKDIQIQTQEFDPGAGNVFFAVNNAAEATVWGVDAEYSHNLSRNFGVDVAASYINGEFGDFETVDFFDNAVDNTGNRLPRAPRLSLSTGLNLRDVDLGSGLSLSSRLEGNYRSKIFYKAENILQQDELFLVNAHVQLDIDDGRYFVRVAGRNLTDEGFTTFDNGMIAIHGRPREFFATVGVSF